MAIKTTYASELGKCYAKTADGRFRAYLDGTMYRVYLVGREMRFNEDYSFAGYGKRLTAQGMIYFRNLENFEMAVYECEDELRCLMAQGA